MTTTPSGSRWTAFAGSLTPTKAFCLVLLAGALVAGATMTWRTELPEAIVPTQAAAEMTPAEVLAEDQARARERMRCDMCGVVETIDHTEAAGTAGGSYRFGVRMGDGTLRHSNGPEAARWRIGDRIMLLGGTPVPAPP